MGPAEMSDVALSRSSHARACLHDIEGGGHDRPLAVHPGHIGSLAIRNRIVKSATLENMADADGRPTGHLLRFYTALARGGAGLLVTGFSYREPHWQGVSPAERCPQRRDHRW